MTQPNPYDSPAPVPTPSKSYTQGSHRLDYGEMFRFVFSNPNWMMTLVWGSLCILLGGFIVPQMVLSGYLWENLERLHKRETTSYADFDTNRFSEYLMRGVWPFLVQLLMSFLMVILIVPVMICGMMGVAVGGANERPEVGAIVMVGMYATIFALSILFQLIILPFALRAGLAQDLGTAFNFGWARDFFGVMWKELLMGTVVLGGAGIACYFVGLALCCIGVYPAMVVWVFASTHFIWQVYEVFLKRGGEPIPLKAPPMLKL